MNMNAYAFEQHTACYALVTLKLEPHTWTRVHKQCMDPKGAGSPEPPGHLQFL